MTIVLKLAITDASLTLAPPPDALDDSTQVWRDIGGKVCAYANTSDGLHWMHLPNLASFSFSSDGREVKAIAHSPSQADLIREAYYRSVLPVALQALGTEVLHASGFVAKGGVIALCANSGTGKSTLACGMNRRGYPLWADDAVAYESDDTKIRSIPLPFSLRLRPEAAAFFGPAPQSMPHDSCQKKSAGEPLSLRALVVLGRTETKRAAAVESARLWPNQGFVKVLAHAYCFSLADVSRKRLMITNYLELVRKVPVYEISFKEGIKNLPAILDCVGELACEACAEAE